jgi:hypothetical protein
LPEAVLLRAGWGLRCAQNGVHGGDPRGRGRRPCRLRIFDCATATVEQQYRQGAPALADLAALPFAANAARLQLHALACNLGNFMRTLELAKEVEHWSLTTIREKLVKIGAKVVSHGRYVTF